MFDLRRTPWALTLLLLVGACGGKSEDASPTQPGPAGPSAAGLTLETLPVNTATVACSILTADDLAVESCNKVVGTWVLLLRKRPYAVTIGLPSIDAGTYAADRGGQGLAITFSDATDLSDIQNYGMKELKVVLQEEDGAYTGTYDGVVLKDYVEEIPIHGMFRFDGSKVSE